MKEIGSEFWNIPTQDCSNGLLPESTRWYLSGRSALHAVIRELKNCRTVAMPAWCCDSMIKPFIDAGLEVHFYPVYWQNGLVQEISLNSDVLFLIDYFGYTSTHPKINDYHGIVIRDVTHSLFSSQYTDADFYFGSLRKWCGFWTGGYAWTTDEHTLTTARLDDHRYIELRKQAMRMKAEYVSGHRFDKSYLAVFEEAEERLESVGIASAAERDVQQARLLDIDSIKTRRRSNAEIIRAAFPGQLVFPEMRSTDTPMFVPVIVPDGKRDALRSHLIKNDIYCPIHWPMSNYHKLDERSTAIYWNELSLVCDQRYTEEDMHRLVNTIRAFWKEA